MKASIRVMEVWNTQIYQNMTNSVLWKCDESSFACLSDLTNKDTKNSLQHVVQWRYILKLYRIQLKWIDESANNMSSAFEGIQHSSVLPTINCFISTLAWAANAEESTECSADIACISLCLSSQHVTITVICSSYFWSIMCMH